MFSYFYDRERERYIVVGGDGLEYAEFDRIEGAIEFCAMNNWRAE